MNIATAGSQPGDDPVPARAPLRGFFVVDCALRIAHLDAGAASLLAAYPHVLRRERGMLRAVDPTWQSELKELVCPSNNVPRSHRAHASPDYRLRVDVHPFVRDRSSHGDGAQRLLEVRTLDRLPDIGALAREFDLSEAEVDILSHLCAGTTLSICALRRDVTLNTVRKQTKSLYAKLGVHSQVEAVVLAFWWYRQRSTRSFSYADAEASGFFAVPNRFVSFDDAQRVGTSTLRNG